MRASAIQQAVLPRVEEEAQPCPKPSVETAAPSDDFRSKNPSFDAVYWTKIGSLAGRAPAVATKAEALRDHATAWSSRLDIVRHAKDTLLCASYFIQPDSHGIAFMDELIKAAKRGVKVGLVFDTMAMPYTQKFSTKEQIAKLESQMTELVQFGGHVSFYGGLSEQAKLPGSGMHFKAIVADGNRAMTGGRNIGGHYYGELFNDFEMLFEGPIARQLADDTLRMLSHGDATRLFHGAKKQIALAFGEFRQDAAYRVSTARLSTEKPVGLYHVVTWDVMHQRAGKNDQNRCALALAETIKRAKREITLTSNYATGSKLLRQSVIDAAKRGVTVRIISTGESASKLSKAAFHMSQPAFKELIAAGVQIYETQNTPDHAKLYVIDDVAAFGTYNFADYGDSRLVDTLVFTGEDRDVAALRAVLQASIDSCMRVDPSVKQKRPLGDKAMGALANVAWKVRR